MFGASAKAALKMVLGRRTIQVRRGHGTSSKQNVISCSKFRASDFNISICRTQYDDLLEDKNLGRQMSIFLSVGFLPDTIIMMRLS